MRNLIKLSIPLVLGVLLVGALVGVASARPSARPQEQAWRVLAVPANACTAANDNTDYSRWTRLKCNFLQCVFYCPVDFPAAGEQAVGAVKVKRFTMYASNNDYTSSGGIAASLRKMYPPTGASVTMAQVQTYTDMPGIQTIIDTTIASNPVFRTQSPYVWVGVDKPGTAMDVIELSGFFIHYTW
jgi:hypothetical protein